MHFWHNKWITYSPFLWGKRTTGRDVGMEYSNRFEVASPHTFNLPLFKICANSDESGLYGKQQDLIFFHPYHRRLAVFIEHSKAFNNFCCVEIIFPQITNDILL